MSIPASGGKCQIISLGMLPTELKTDNFIKKYFNSDDDGSGVLESVNLNNKNEFDKLPEKIKEAVLPYAINGEVSVSGRIQGQNSFRNNVFNTTIFDENGDVYSSVTLNSSYFDYYEEGQKMPTYKYERISDGQYAKLVDSRDSARTKYEEQERIRIREEALNYLRGNVQTNK